MPFKSGVKEKTTKFFPVVLSVPLHFGGGIFLVILLFECKKKKNWKQRQWQKPWAHYNMKYFPAFLTQTLCTTLFPNLTKVHNTIIIDFHKIWNMQSEKKKKKEKKSELQYEHGMNDGKLFACKRKSISYWHAWHFFLLDDIKNKAKTYTNSICGFICALCTNRIFKCGISVISCALVWIIYRASFTAYISPEASRICNGIS